MCELQHDVVTVQCTQKICQLFPPAALDRLATVIPETEVDGALNGDLIENRIDRPCGNRPIRGIAGNVRLVHLHAFAGQVGDLAGKHVRNGHQ